MTAMIIGGEIGAKELILIILAIVILFGGKKIPELMRGLGEGVREFKKSARVDEPQQTKEKEITKTENKE
jgi:sec-independent protein translocase protein TatA